MVARNANSTMCVTVSIVVGTRNTICLIFLHWGILVIHCVFISLRLKSSDIIIFWLFVILSYTLSLILALARQTCALIINMLCHGIDIWMHLVIVRVFS